MTASHLETQSLLPSEKHTLFRILNPLQGLNSQQEYKIYRMEIEEMLKFQHLLALFCGCNMREVKITGSDFEIASSNMMKEEFYLDVQNNKKTGKFRNLTDILSLVLGTKLKLHRRGYKLPHILGYVVQAVQQIKGGNNYRTER